MYNIISPTESIATNLNGYIFQIYKGQNIAIYNSVSYSKISCNLKLQKSGNGIYSNPFIFDTCLDNYAGIEMAIILNFVDGSFYKNGETTNKKSGIIVINKYIIEVDRLIISGSIKTEESLGLFSHIDDNLDFVIFLEIKKLKGRHENLLVYMDMINLFINKKQ